MRRISIKESYGDNITNGKDYTESVPKIEKDTIL